MHTSCSNDALIFFPVEEMFNTRLFGGNTISLPCVCLNAQKMEAHYLMFKSTKGLLYLVQMNGMVLFDSIENI